MWTSWSCLATNRPIPFCVWVAFVCNSVSYRSFLPRCSTYFPWTPLFDRSLITFPFLNCEKPCERTGQCVRFVARPAWHPAQATVLPGAAWPVAQWGTGRASPCFAGWSVHWKPLETPGNPGDTWFSSWTFFDDFFAPPKKRMMNMKYMNDRRMGWKNMRSRWRWSWCMPLRSSFLTSPWTRASSTARCSQKHNWLVVWNIFYFSIYWEEFSPNWRSLHHFSEGFKQTTNQIRRALFSVLSFQKERTPFLDESSTRTTWSFGMLGMEPLRWNGSMNFGWVSTLATRPFLGTVASGVSQRTSW